MNFPGRRQQFGAVLMSVWLCAWIGVSLLHSLEHAAHPHGDSHSTCLVCHLLDQPAPVLLDTKLALRQTPQFECVRQLRVETSLRSAQFFPRSVVPRGPPALLFA